jgi:uncharacterized iron-regulated protein
MSQPTFEKNVHIPVLSDLVVEGDPTLKQQVRANLETIECEKQAYDRRIQQKMNDLSQVIGQEEGDNIARAHAIRSEASSINKKVSDTHHEMNLDRDRAAVMRRLSRRNSH